MLPHTSLIDTYQQADALLAEGKLQQAADICKQMLEVNPGFAYGYHLMASLFRSTGNMDRALVFSELAIKLDPNVPSFYVQRGQILFTLSRLEEAGMVFETLRKLQPTNAIYMVLSADVHARLGQYNEAMALFAQARAMGSAGDMAEIDEHEGLCMLAMGDAPKAEALFDRVIAQRPSYDYGYILKGRLLLAQRRDHEAEVCFARAINCNPHSYEALHGMAVVNERQGQIDSAIAFSIQAINVNNAIFDSLVLLASLLARKQNWEAAEQIYRQALSVIPHNIYALHGLVQVLAAQKRFAEMPQEIEPLLAAQPDNVALRFLLEAARKGQVASTPEAYVTAYFDDYASRYDYYLQPAGFYPPVIVQDILGSLRLPTEESALTFLDLGCGGGALGDALRGITQLRVGVDLSQRMLDAARLRQCYHELYALDITQFAMGSDRMFDIIAAIDVLAYVGDIEPFFRAARNLMASGSILLFSFEQHEAAQDYLLHYSARYSYSRRYMAELLASHGYEVLVQEEMHTRVENGLQVKACLVAIRKMTVH